MYILMKRDIQTDDAISGYETNQTPSVPNSVPRYLPDKESNFLSGILNFLVEIQEFPNKTNVASNSLCVQCANESTTKDILNSN